MKINLNRKYWLLLMAVILCVGLFPNQSNASVASTAVWQTVLPITEVTASSEYLTREGQTIALSPLTEARSVTFSVETNRSQMPGTLKCTVSPAEALSVSAPDVLIATQEGAEATLTLTPGQVSQQTQATVTVCWTAQSGQVLQADFVTVIAPEETLDWPQVRVDAAIAVGEDALPGVAVPVIVTYPANTTQLVLSLGDGAAFPAGTAYRLDYEEENILLYDPAQIVLTPTGKETVILLTLPESMLADAQPVKVQAQVITPIGKMVLTGQTTPLSANHALPENAFYVLTAGESCMIPLTADWSGTSLSYTIARLTQTENGIEFRTVADAASSSLTVTGGTEGITLRLAGNGLQAGTYRLTLVWSYQTYTVARQEVLFYAGYPDSVATGGNVQ